VRTTPEAADVPLTFRGRACQRGVCATSAAAGLLRRVIRRRLLPLSLVATLAFAAPAAAAPGSGPAALAGPLAKLAQPGVRTAPRAERARVLSLPPSGPGSLLQRGRDVVVDVRAKTTSAAQADRLRAAGAQVLHVAPDLRTITVAVAPSELTALATGPGVENVSPELTPLTSAHEAGGTCQGSVTSEADTQLRAALAREDFGVSGAGVTVGVLSDSYDVNTADAKSAADGVASGDLPGPGNPCGRTTSVNVLAEGSASGTDEGRGMLELVHDIAPDAALAFATAAPATAFPDRVAALRSAGADVLVDDVTFYDDPFFQPGPASVAIDQARTAGTAYFSSAGNFNMTASGQNRSSWEAPGWRSTTCPTGVPPGYTACMNFAAATDTPNNQLKIRVLPGRRVTLDFQWAEPWFGVDTDLDLILYSGSTAVAASVQENNGASGTQKPFEILSWENTSANTVDVTLTIAKWGNGPDPDRMKAVLTAGGAAVVGATAPEDRFGPTIIGHNGAAGAMSVAAVPYSDAAQIESFSSRGPVTHYFGPVNGTVPAAPLAQPQALVKPDIAATDGTLTTFFPGGSSRFFGTSAAAPHAAAVAALQLEAAPDATVAQVYDAQRVMARAVGALGADAAGAGLLDAYAAIDRITQGPPVATTSTATAVTSSTATLPASVNPHRLDTSAHFEYGPAGGPLTTTPSESIGSGKANVDVSATITGLEPNTTYTYRVVATNTAGTTQGENLSLITAAVAPLAQTGAASAITTTAATVAGVGNPQGSATSAHFEYGLTTAYGSETDAQDLGSGRAGVDVTAPLAGLEPATTYHYRLVTSNSAGTTVGEDRTFTTAARAVVTPPPSVPPLKPIPDRPSSPIPPQRTVTLMLTGRTLRVTGARDVTRATVRVRQGRRTLVRKRLRVRSGAMQVRLRWSDVRNRRLVTVSLGAQSIRIDLRARKLRLSVGGFTAATLQLSRRGKPLAAGSLMPPSRVLTLRLQQPRRPRADDLVVVAHVR
jgi:hypothetical protein